MLEKSTFLWKDFKDNLIEGPQGKEERYGEHLCLLRENLSGREQNVGRDMSGEGHSDEVLDGNEGHAIGQEDILLNMEERPFMFWRDRERGCIVFVSWSLWKVEFVSNVIGYLTETLSKQSVEGVA